MFHLQQPFMLQNVLGWMKPVVLLAGVCQPSTCVMV